MSYRDTDWGARNVRLAATALASVVLAVAATSCGGAKPLASFSDTQRAQLGATWSAAISATDSAVITPADREQRATALHTACRSLDRSNALLQALTDTCGPIYVTEKLAAVLPGRCATPAAMCSRALDRIATSTDDLAAKLGNLGSQAKLLIKDPACRAEFQLSAPRLAAYGELSSAYRVVSLGVEQKEKDVATLGQHRIDDAEILIGDQRSVAARTAAFRKNCGLS